MLCDRDQTPFRTPSHLISSNFVLPGLLFPTLFTIEPPFRYDKTSQSCRVMHQSALSRRIVGLIWTLDFLRASVRINLQSGKRVPITQDLMSRWVTRVYCQFTPLGLIPCALNILLTDLGSGIHGQPAALGSRG